MNSSLSSISRQVKRLGIIFVGLEKANLPAFRFILLQINSLQHTFEYEFLPLDKDDEFIKSLFSELPVDREWLRSKVSGFAERYQTFLYRLINTYKLKEEPPKSIIIVTMACFSDNYYSMRQDGISVLALGNWQRAMAPPSIAEFMLTLILRESVAAISTSLRGSVHLGTKGCLFDFTQSLDEVRYKVLNGFICSHCRNVLDKEGHLKLADELVFVLGKQWLGKISEPNSSASIALKLGYNLFTTKGFETTAWEKFKGTIQEEGIKQLIQIIGTIVIAGLLLWLGLK